MVVLYQSLVVAYARAIYLDGTKKFPEIKPDYVEPVKKYAAANYSVEQIDNALNQEYITLQEYNDTMAYKAA